MPRRHGSLAFSKGNFCQDFKQNPRHCKIRESMNLAHNAHSCLYTPFLFISALKSAHHRPGGYDWRAGQWGIPSGGRAQQNSHISIGLCVYHFIIPIPLKMDSSLEPCKEWQTLCNIIRKV